MYVLSDLSSGTSLKQSYISSLTLMELRDGLQMMVQKQDSQLLRGISDSPWDKLSDEKRLELYSHGIRICVSSVLDYEYIERPIGAFCLFSEPRGRNRTYCV